MAWTSYQHWYYQYWLLVIALPILVYRKNTWACVKSLTPESYANEPKVLRQSRESPKNSLDLDVTTPRLSDCFASGPKYLLNLSEDDVELAGCMHFCCYLWCFCIAVVDFAVIYNVFVPPHTLVLLFTMFLHTYVVFCCYLQCFGPCWGSWGGLEFAWKGHGTGKVLRQGLTPSYARSYASYAKVKLEEMVFPGGMWACRPLLQLFLKCL